MVKPYKIKIEEKLKIRSLFRFLMQPPEHYYHLNFIGEYRKLGIKG